MSIFHPPMERGQLFVVGPMALRVLDPGLVMVRLPRLKLQLYHADYARILGAIDRTPYDVVVVEDKGPSPYHSATLPALGNEIRLPLDGDDITMPGRPAIRFEKLH